MIEIGGGELTNAVLGEQHDLSQKVMILRKG
jgi:hypothetical protein